jgi:aminoglycoside phosphotransferase (APT) family kinase protein
MKIPEPQRDTARLAIATALGRVTIDSIRPVPGGVSGAFVFRVDAGGRRYVLRMEGPASPLRNPHQYASMRIAAEAGIAPRLHHIDEAAGVAVMDFIEDRPLEAFPGGARGLAQAAGQMLKQLQALPPFPRFVAYPDIVARLWAHVCRTGLFAEGVLAPHTDRLARIRDAYDWNSESSVSSHNDLLPRNLLFDGHRLWLIDWESACLNDPLVDVGTALDNFAPTPELEEVLLQSWLGHAPDQSLRERLALTRGLSRLFYAGVLLSASALASRAQSEADLSALTHAEFEQEVRSGRLKPETPETSHALGKIFLASFLSGAVPPGLPPMFMR